MLIFFITFCNFFLLLKFQFLMRLLQEKLVSKGDLVKKKKRLQLLDVFYILYYTKFILRAINVVPNIVDDRADTLGVL